MHGALRTPAKIIGASTRAFFTRTSRAMRDGTASAPSASKRLTFSTDYLTPLTTAEDFVQGERGQDAVVLLNTEIPMHALTLWQLSAYRVCADGGANRVQSLRSVYESAARKAKYTGPDAFKHPDRVVGDMDSISPSVRAMYECEDGVCVFDDQSTDQETTDFVKCLRAIVKHAPHIERVFVLGALNGRLDHVLYNLKTLFEFPNLQVVLIGDDSSARALPVGETVIRRDERYESIQCGLIPLQGDAHVTTRGLRWDLNNDVMSFGAGGLISTSNQFASDEVVVRTDAPLLWTTEFSSKPHSSSMS